MICGLKQFCYFTRFSLYSLNKAAPIPPNHVAVPVANNELECTIDSTAVYEMNDIEKKWSEPVAPPPSSTPNSPSFDQLVDELKVESTRWYEIGVHLLVPLWKLNTIGKEEKTCLEQLIKALEYWQKNGNLKMGNPFSWKTVVKVLRKIKNNDLAEMIEAKYLNTSR